MAKPSREERKRLRERERRRRAAPAGSDEPFEPNAGDADAPEEPRPERDRQQDGTEAAPVAQAGAEPDKPPPWRRAKRQLAERDRKGSRAVVGIFLFFVVIAAGVIWWSTRPEPTAADAGSGSDASASATATSPAPAPRPFRAPGAGKPAVPGTSDFAPPLRESGEVEPPAAPR